jgi:hypothetical protein
MAEMIDSDGVLRHKWSEDGAGYSLWLEDVDDCLALSAHTEHSSVALSLDVELAKSIIQVCTAYVRAKES